MSDAPFAGPLNGSLFGEDNVCFGCAVDHPFGFRMDVEREGDGVLAQVQPEAHHQGPLGLVHGGLLMTLADEIGAWAVIAETGKFGFTTGFSGRLVGPARVAEPIECRARALGPIERTAQVEVKLAQGTRAVLEGTFDFALLGRRAAERLLGRALPEAWLALAR